MKLLNVYKNGNHTVKIFDDGTKIKETIDPNADHFTYDFAENFDLKLTDRCNAGCIYCHENSTVNGKHGDWHKIEKIIDQLQPGTEIACLSGNTIVHTPTGSKHINELSIGDKIYNSENTISKIKKITKTNKKNIKLKLKRGFSIVCSEDHPFMVNNVQICAKDLCNKIIDSVHESVGDNNITVIDMAKYIHPANNNIKSSRGGKIFGDDEIRLTNSSKHSKRYIKFDEDMAYLYGWFAAEGSRSGLALNLNEIDYANEICEIWKNHTNLPASIYINAGMNSIQVELKNRTFVQHLFNDEFNIGHGARNKNLSYLYKVTNKEIIRRALFGLIMGDGCFRTQNFKHSKQDFYIVELKTASEYLAYDFVYLLKRWFNIQASIVHNKHTSERPINGRKLPLTDYYAVTICNQNDLTKLFPSIYNYKWQKTDTSRKLEVIEINDIDSCDDLYDITLDGDIHTFPINGCLITHNCGGGNILEYPELVQFLDKLKSKGIIANVTINQKHLRPYKDLICKLVAEKLVHGIGISLVDSSNKDDFEFIDMLGDNVVIHTIAGILDEDDLVCLKGRKVLILGYKDLRRGSAYLTKDYANIVHKMDLLRNLWLGRMKDECRLVSFDCLAIEQLDPKTQLQIDDARWKTLFQGADTDVTDEDGNITCSTFYMDLPNMQVARMSTAALDKRFDFTGDEDISELFKMTTQGW